MAHSISYVYHEADCRTAMGPVPRGIDFSAEPLNTDPEKAYGDKGRIKWEDLPEDREKVEELLNEDFGAQCMNVRDLCWPYITCVNRMLQGDANPPAFCTDVPDECRDGAMCAVL